MLTHLVPWNDQAQTLEEACRSSFAGPISLAASGQSIDVD
jgi:ribonuclease BN (tRNA processing enzyme)